MTQICPRVAMLPALIMIYLSALYFTQSYFVCMYFYCQVGAIRVAQVDSMEAEQLCQDQAALRALQCTQLSPTEEIFLCQVQSYVIRLKWVQT